MARYRIEITPVIGPTARREVTSLTALADALMRLGVPKTDARRQFSGPRTWTVRWHAHPYNGAHVRWLKLGAAAVGRPPAPPKPQPVPDAMHLGALVERGGRRLSYWSPALRAGHCWAVDVDARQYVLLNLTTLEIRADA